MVQRTLEDSDQDAYLAVDPLIALTGASDLLLKNDFHLTGSFDMLPGIV